MAAPKKPAPKVIRPVVKAMTATPEKPAPDPMRVIGPAPGDLPAGSEGLVTQGPTQAGLDAAAKIDRQRVIANTKARQAARQAGTSGPGASSSGGAKPRTHLGFATEEDAIAGGLHVARPPAGFPDAWGQGGTRIVPPGATQGRPSSSGGAKPNPSAFQHANPNARFKRGPGKPKPASRRRPTRPTTRTRA